MSKLRAFEKGKESESNKIRIFGKVAFFHITYLTATQHHPINLRPPPPQDLSGIGLHDSGKHSDEGSLSGSVFSKKDNNLEEG